MVQPADPNGNRIALAQVALERGDYGQVLRLLNPPEGEAPSAEALLLLTTAYMGQGNSSAALACCHKLRRCGDSAIRAQARELQRVLEAPALTRPREWSLTLPALGDSDPALGRRLGQLQRRRRPKPPPPPPPAVGPTQAPLGFALVVTVLVVVGLLLGGCGANRTDLHFDGPGRLQISLHSTIEGSGPSPWQRQLSRQLRQEGFKQRQQGSDLVLSTALLPSRLALGKLQHGLEQGAQLAGLDLAIPQLKLRSRNWLIAVDERIDLQLDLSALKGWDLPLSLRLIGLKPQAVGRAEPLPVTHSDGSDVLLWPLQAGAANQLVLQHWSWNPLGLGALGCALLLLLSLTLQRIRRRLGFGLPELPP